ncbi:protein of unknown function [Candidatus Filomicrobium marinum]|uniref:Uncharacterized protein n=1 Tax=Candidatus Filomicrobium marinum TaxID=1608628 RepID=A0A0D6JF23_9HYPH|nr:protein of unknown function [Candidatus Filomicrobium marinum]CPR19185.1 protein of unknown function [Candidatus Filomicrobium marinum]
MCVSATRLVAANKPPAEGEPAHIPDQHGAADGAVFDWSRPCPVSTFKFCSSSSIN